MSATSILDVIGHYQRSIERSQNVNGEANAAKFLHCIEKLNKLPINVEHLQATGIGKTVNSLRKYDGEVGVASKALVAKWKAVVTAEEYANELAASNLNERRRDDNDEDSDTSRKNKDVNDNFGTTGRSKEYEREQTEKSRNNNDNSNSKNDINFEGKSSSSRNKSNGQPNYSKHSSSRKENTQDDTKYKNKRLNTDSPSINTPTTPRIYDNDTDGDDDDDEEKLIIVEGLNNGMKENSTKNRHHETSSESKRDKYSSTSKSSKDKSSRHGKDHSSTSSNNTKHTHHKDRNENKHQSDNKKSHTSSKYKLSPSHIEKTSSSSSSKHSKSENTSTKKESSSKNEKDSSTRSDVSKNTDKDKYKDKNNHKLVEKTEKVRDDKHHKSNHDSRSKEKESHSSSKNNEREGHGTRDREKESSSSRDKNTYKEKERSEKSSSKSQHKTEIKDGSGTINGKSKRRNSNHEDKNDEKSCEVTSTTSPKLEKKPKVIKYTSVDIDSTTGTSFEDALGMMMFPSKKLKTSNKIISPSKSSSSEETTSKRRSSRDETSKRRLSRDETSKRRLSRDETSKRRLSRDETSKRRLSRDEPSGSGTNNKKAKYNKPSTSSSKSDSDSDVKLKTSPLALLSSNINLKPLDPNIALELPIISNNYKPMPLNPTVMECVFSQQKNPIPQRMMQTDEEAYAHGISSKTMRTKVYSGSKTGQILQVTSLFDLCIRTLQKNIDALEYTGGVPFDILKPVLVRATPDQLINFEEFNPYLMVDTDCLWEQHVNRRFRGQKRQEMESWREMFLRCKDHQDALLNRLTENIKQSQIQISLPVRKTQLAYVDSMVKPPRNIKRKQEKFGTIEKLVATPAARVAALQTMTPNAVKSGDVRLRVAAGIRDNAQALGVSSKPKKAPLMAKTLQFIKGRLKR